MKKKTTKKTTKWCGHIENCDVCGKKIARIFFDTKTRSGPWAVMCPACYERGGVKIDLCGGAEYRLSDSAWLKQIPEDRPKPKRPRKFILCPCGAKSKKLYSEMGGLQTRRCQNGHTFEVDTFFKGMGLAEVDKKIKNPYGLW